MSRAVRAALLACASLFPCVGLPRAFAEGARILEAPGLPPFVELQDAVDAAAEGDTILVAAGTYGGVTIAGKGVSLVAAPDQIVQIAGTLEVLDLPAASEVVLSGLVVTGAVLEISSAPALVVSNCAGQVRVEACTLRGGAGHEPPGESQVYGRGGHGVVLQGSPKVAFSRSTLQGGNGGDDPQQCYDCTGGDGGLGVRASLSTAAFHDCTIRGGDGGQNGFAGGHGGHGVRLLNSWMFVAGSSLTGGKGGNAWDFIFAAGGDGGAGVFVDPGATAELLDNVYAGGAGGIAFVFPANNGTPGELKTGGGNFVEHAGTARSLAAARVVIDDQQPILVNLQGQPGDAVWVRIGTQPAFLPQLSIPGVGLVKPGHVTKAALGVIGPSGSLGMALPAPDLELEPGRVLYLQAFGRDAFGGPWLAGSEQSLVIDRLGPPDCNANAVNDLVDAFLHTSADCGPNLQPDECDPDCNGNGTPDDCDLAGGTADCNGNAVPDSCDIAGGQSVDCNANGVPDTCDLASGASSDANGNGVPDECDPNMAWWVDAAAAAGGNGSAGAPFQTIAQGFQVAIDGDEIVVRDGTYVGDGNRDVAFSGREIVVRSQNGPATCVIDLQQAGRAFLVDGGTGPAARIEGFTFLDGSQFDGGAVKVQSSRATLRNCRFVACQGGTGGAVNLAFAGGTLIENCVFLDNSTPPVIDPFFNQGGAIYISGNSGVNPPVRVRRCIFQGNTAGDGGAIHSNGVVPVFLSHCIFRDNQALRWGGAIQNRSWNPNVFTLDDCLFAGNSAGDDGGAIRSHTFFLNEPSDLRIRGCTFSDNTAGDTGGAVAMASNGKLHLANCVLWGNSAPFGPELARDQGGSTTWGVPELTVERCDVFGGQALVHQTGAGTTTWGAGNLDLDPQFTDADGPDNDPATVLDNDYRPIAGSPVNDAGGNALVPADVNDIDGDGNVLEPTPLDLLLAPRFVEDPLAPNTGAGTPPLVDMGCYERP
jgi:predicted outer membrane repeat protein